MAMLFELLEVDLLDIFVVSNGLDGSRQLDQGLFLHGLGDLLPSKDAGVIALFPVLQYRGRPQE